MTINKFIDNIPDEFQNYPDALLTELVQYHKETQERIDKAVSGKGESFFRKVLVKIESDIVYHQRVIEDLAGI